MGTKTVCVHRYEIPQLDTFYKKYYFLITLLFFEFQSNGYYRDDIEISGFSDSEMSVITNLFSNFDIEGRMLRISEFDIYMVNELIAILPNEWKKLLIDHMVLSSIDKYDNIKDAMSDLKQRMMLTSSYLPFQEMEKKDFIEFFKGEDSNFMNEYYPNNEEKAEIRLRYGIRNTD